MTEPTAIQTPPTSRRLQWLDIVRGLALIAMASYHFMWDLSSFGYLEPGYPSTGWPRLYARVIASTFLFLVGFSLVLSHGDRIRWRSFWKRWFIIVAAALLVTAASYFAIPQGLIHFGILHAIAATSLIGLIFLRMPWPIAFVAAIGVFVAPFYLRSDMFNQPGFWWIGLSTQPRQSFDYVPLLPWFAAVLSGIGVARLPIVLSWLRQYASGEKPLGRLKSALAFLGRHSLVFYLVHQPVLISILYGVSLAYPAPGDPVKFVKDCVATCPLDVGEAFCKRFCDCALKGLEKDELLAPLQSGTMPATYRGAIDKIRSQCTVEAGPVSDDTGN